MPELIWQLVIAFSGGILLNLTPCVLPVIPLKVRALLAEAQREHARRGIAAVSLLAGSLAVFVPLGLVTAYLNLQWGFLFQSRAFLVALTLLLFLGGAAMILKLSIKLPGAVYAMEGKHAAPFMTGALAGVLSTPCTGPFLGSVLVFSLTQPPSTVLAIFIAIGAGLVAPYIALLLIPGLLERFPKSGAWTARIEELLGFILIGGGIFFLNALVSAPVVWAAIFATATLFISWIGYHTLISKESGGARAVPLIALATGVLAYILMSGSGDNAALPWQPWSAGELASAREQQRPVLLEFTADWCINCKVLERTVYADARVIEVGNRHRLAALRVDLTQPEADKQSLLLDYGGAGLPFAVVLDINHEVVRTFPDIFGTDALLEAIEHAGAGAATANTRELAYDK